MLYVVTIANYGDKLYTFLDKKMIDNAPYIFKSKENAQKFYNKLVNKITMQTHWDNCEKFIKTASFTTYTLSTRECFDISIEKRRIRK